MTQREPDQQQTPSGNSDARPGTGMDTDEQTGPESTRVQEADFDPDVERLHRPIFREPPDPREGREPVPWWLWAIAAIVIFWGGWFLGEHGGRLSNEPHLTYPQRTEFVVKEAGEQDAEAGANLVEAGETVYRQRCQSCHQQNGRGLPGVFPPLVGSEWVTGPPETPVRIVLSGLQGPIEVAGATYNGVMPAWRDELSDEQIAAVITFIRQWESNEARPVSSEMIRMIREATANRTTSWTAEELRAAE